MLVFIFRRVTTMLAVLWGIDTRLSHLERELAQLRKEQERVTEKLGDALTTLARLEALLNELNPGPAVELNLSAGPISEQP